MRVVSIVYLVAVFNLHFFGRWIDMKVAINTAVFLHAMQNGVRQSDCVHRLKGYAIDAVEVRGEFFHPDTKTEELAAISEFCQQEQLDFYYSVPEELFTEDDVNSSLVQNLELAQKYQIKGLKYSFGALPTLSPEKLAVLRSILNCTRIEVTIENQPNSKGAIEAFTRKLDWLHENKLPLGYTFDSGNWYWINETPEQAFSVVAPEISIFHLKDILKEETVLLGQGTTDWQILIKKLAPNIPIFLEYDISEDALNDQVNLVNEALRDRWQS